MHCTWCELEIDEDTEVFKDSEGYIFCSEECRTEFQLENFEEEEEDIDAS